MERKEDVVSKQSRTEAGGERAASFAKVPGVGNRKDEGVLSD